MCVDIDGDGGVPSSGILQEQELLSGERFARVVNELKGVFDYVLVVTGPQPPPPEASMNPPKCVP